MREYVVPIFATCAGLAVVWYAYWPDVPPLWLMLVVGLGLVGITMIPDVSRYLRVVGRGRAKRRRLGGRCVGCGYDLRASLGRCPECGRTPLARRFPPAAK